MSATEVKLRLYDIPEAIRDTLERAVDPETGEINEEMEAQLDALEEAFETKAEYIALLTREALAEEAAVRQEEDRLAKRRKAAGNRAGRLKNYLHACMIQAGADRLETDRARIRVQRNPAPAIRWTLDPDALPVEYRRVTVAPDLTLAKERLKADQPLPDGFTVEWGSHVRIS